MRPTPLWSDPVLLDRYLSGETTPDESRAIDHWLAANPEERRVLDAVRAGVIDPYGPVPVYDANVRTAAIVDYSVRAVRRMRRQSETIGTSSVSRRFMQVEHGELSTKVTSPTVQGNRVLGPHPLRQIVWPAAAALILVVVVTVLGWTIGMRHGSKRSATSMLTYTTESGQRATITLPDGGTVALNVASRLEVPMDYMAGHHTVWLAGEALFTVSHHSGMPFTVIAGSTVARVLGTSFVVRRYASDTTTLVTVRDGKVAIRSVVLTAARQVVIDRAGIAHVQAADPAQFSFATGELTLNDIPLSEAIPELDRWYDVDIRLGDATMASRALTGKFGAGSLADLTMLLRLTGVHVVGDGRVLTLFSR